MFQVGPFELLFIVMVVVLAILPFWKIFAKAGFSGWLSLTMIVPLLNVVMLFYLAFAEWPMHRDTRG